MKEKSALILGSSGLVGSELLKLCLDSDSYDKIIAPVRTSLNINHRKLIQKTIDFDG